MAEVSSHVWVLFFSSYSVGERMQRRPGKGAHIASPMGKHPSGMGSDKEKQSRFTRRNFNRIWVILALFLAILAFTHYILPSNHPSRNVFTSTNLKPKHYLNASEVGPSPFDFCPIFGPGDEIGAKHGALTLGRSRLHLGSGARIQRVLNRALAGQPVTISILGGSGAHTSAFRPFC